MAICITESAVDHQIHLHAINQRSQAQFVLRILLRPEQPLAARIAERMGKIEME